MKPLYKIETIVDPDSKLDRARVIEQKTKLEAIRKETGAFINMVKKNKLRIGLEQIRDTVRFYRRNIISELEARRSYYQVTRYVGKHGAISLTLNSLEDLKDIVTEFRSKIKQKRRRLKELDYSGRCREIDIKIFQRKPNWVLHEFARRQLNEYKKPTDNAQYVGIEIECVLPKTFQEIDLAKFGKWLNIGTDGSIQYDSSKETSRELRVLCKREEVRTLIPDLMNTLAEMKASVNKSCGLHIHLDQRQALNPADNFLKLVRSLNLLYTVVPKSRRENQYCHRNRRTNFEVAVRGERYKAINASAYRKFKTLEVRLFGGTLNAEKIINWIETLHAIVEGTVPARAPRTFEGARSHWTGLTDENLAWLKARQKQFAALNIEAPFAESETEDQPDYDEEDAEPEVYCEHCDESGDHYTEDCESELAEAV